MTRPAFTLIELLVVVTIIVLLLALLTPALDRAVYSAELAVCGANQKVLGQSVQSYATDHKRVYPHRQAAASNPPLAWPSCKLSGGNAPTDVRRVVARYILVNKMLIDPLCQAVELERDSGVSEQVFASMDLWFGWRIDGEQAMRRIGDRWTYNGQSFSVLASDSDTFDYDRWVQSSHPDRSGTLRPWVLKYQTDSVDGVEAGVPGLALTLSRWVRSGGALRGEIDSNAVFDDGSVRRYDRVASHRSGRPDDRMAAVPWISDLSTADRQFTHVPAD
jgi:prepilin-type N-terminal cleavage/methylation domain-containing protein